MEGAVRLRLSILRCGPRTNHQFPLPVSLTRALWWPMVSRCCHLLTLLSSALGRLITITETGWGFPLWLWWKWNLPGHHSVRSNPNTGPLQARNMQLVFNWNYKIWTLWPSVEKSSPLVKGPVKSLRQGLSAGNGAFKPAQEDSL